MLVKTFRKKQLYSKFFFSICIKNLSSRSFFLFSLSPAEASMPILSLLHSRLNDKLYELVGILETLLIKLLTSRDMYVSRFPRNLQ